MTDLIVPKVDQSIDREFLMHLESQFEQAKIPNSCLSMRKSAWKCFNEMGLPAKNNEQFRNIRLRDLYSKKYQLISTQTASVSTNASLVFVNGVFCENLSSIQKLPKGITVLALDKAYKQYGFFLDKAHECFLKGEVNPFAVLNAATSNGAFIYVAPGCRLDHPIEIVNVIENAEQQSLWMNPGLKIFVGKDSQVQFIYQQEIEQSCESSLFINQLVEMTIEQNANVDWMVLNRCDNEVVWNMEAFRADLKQDAHLKFTGLTNSSRTHRQDFCVNLNESGCQVDLNGLWLAKGGKQSHVNVFMNHNAPECRSLQRFKGVMNDFARCSFEGQIYVNQIAQKTQAYQMNNNLILSDHALMQSKPNLKIYADDVKASHGATVGQLDEEQLFYLKSRGIASQEARSLLIHGFAREIIDLVPLSIRLQCENLLRQWHS